MRRPVALVCTALLALLAACGAPAVPAAPVALDPADWDAVLAQARGQTVRWYAYGGDEAYNRFIDGHVTAELAALGVALQRVPVADTADAVHNVLGEQQAGRTADGTVDALWFNVENCATRKEARL